MSLNRLTLVDGTAMLYRAFFAIRGLSTRAGRPTNAVFGLIRMLHQIREVWKPTHWAVVFDGGRPAERVALLEEYKAQRRPVPPELQEQMRPAEEYLDRAGIAWTRQEGQEADDVMASVAAWADADAGEVLLATSDKDMFQLVGGKVRVVPLAGQGPAMGPEEVKAKTGVPPHRIVDWLAMVGDAVDNIPGVPGVGAKTAADLIERYGSLAAVFEHLDSIGKPKLSDALRRNREVAMRNVEMIRLRRDLPCPFDWPAMALKPERADRLIPFFESLEFESLARGLRQGDLFSGL